MFSLVGLECFVAVAEELHFGAAAERLRMTQPPLSRQIQILEREFGTALFTRTSRRVELTAAGRTLLPSARHILDLSAKTASDVRQVAAGNAGTLTIAYTATAAQSALPLLLQRVTMHMPDVSLVLRELVSTEQMDELVRGTVDIGLLRPVVARPGIRSQVMMTEALVAALPPGSRLAQVSGPVSLREFDASGLLMYSMTEARYFHDLVLNLFSAAGVRPIITQYASHVPALLAFVQAGLGAAIVPASATAFAPSGVTIRELAAGENNTVQLSAAWNLKNASPILPRALQLLDLPDNEPGNPLAD